MDKDYTLAMEDDELCFANAWCQREDNRSQFGLSLSQPLLTITETLQQSVLRTLRFPEVAAAKSVSVDGPVRVDNIDQHVRIRSEIIIPTQTIVGSLEESQQHQPCPEGYRIPCRDTARPACCDDDENDDEEDDDEDDEEDEELEDDEECEEEEEECEDDGYRNVEESKEECEDENEDEDEEEEAVMKCCHIKPCRDEPKDKNLPQAPSNYPTDIPVKQPQAPSKYPTDIPVKQPKEPETVQKASVENADKPEVCVTKTPDEDAKGPQEETKKETTNEEEKELSDLHDACLYLSKEELEAICTKYKAYDKRFKIKRAKSGQTGDCKFKTKNKEKDERNSGKQQEESSKEEDNEYFCEETAKENVVNVEEEDDECDEEEEKEKENEVPETKEKDSDDAEDEDYEEEEEIDPYFGPERPCKAAPIVCEQKSKEKTEEPDKECTSRDYSRYDQKNCEEKEKDIFYKISPKFSPKANKKKPVVVCDDDDKIEINNQLGVYKGGQRTECPNNKLLNQDHTLYYDDKQIIQLTTNQKNKKIGIEKKKLCPLDLRKKEDEDYFMGKQSETQKSVEPAPEKVELCTSEYYTRNSNNNSCEDGEAEGGYVENTDDLVKDSDNEDICELVEGTGSGGAEDNKNESCGLATAAGEQTVYHSAQNKPHNGKKTETFKQVMSFSCHENARNQQKYQAYGHSGDDDDAEERYFSSAVLPSGEDAGIINSAKVSYATLPRAEPSYFISELEGPTYSVDHLAISSLTEDVSMTNSHFEQCKRVFESMKQRAFGDDFEDYFESCVSPNMEDMLETNLPCVDTALSADHISPASANKNKINASIDEECEAKRNGFLKGLFGIIGKSGIKQLRKNGKVNLEREAETGDGCQVAKTKVSEKKFFSFGRYKQKHGEKIGIKISAVAKNSKGNNDSLSGKSEKRKFRFGKTVNEKRQKKLDTAGMIENFLAIEKTANQYYEIDDDFEIKNNGYIFKCGKLMKRLNTGKAALLVNENRCSDVEGQESGDVEANSATKEERICETATAGGDSDQPYGRCWKQLQNGSREAAETINETGLREKRDVAGVEEFANAMEVNTPYELANGVVKKSSQTEVRKKLPSVVGIQDAKLGDYVSEINGSVELAGQSGERKQTRSVPEGNSASVRTIVSDESNVDVLQPSLCGFPLTSAENRSKKPGQLRRKVSSFMVVSKSADKRLQNKNKPPNKNKPFHTVIRRKITEQEAVTISRRGHKYKDGKSSTKNKSDKDKDKIPIAYEGYRSKDDTSFSCEKNVLESKSTNRTNLEDGITTIHLHKLVPDSSSVKDPNRKICSSPQKIDKQKAFKKYPEVRYWRGNKSEDCLANDGCRVPDMEVHNANPGLMGKLRPSASSYVVRTSQSSTRAKSETRFPKQKSNKSAEAWTRRSEMSESDHGSKKSFRQNQFVNRNIQGDRKILRETYNNRKGKQVIGKFIEDENHNVNCGADDDDDDDFDDDEMGGCQPQAVSNIIFSDQQHPVQNVRHAMEVPVREATQIIARHDGGGSNGVVDNFRLSEIAECSIPLGGGSRENFPLETVGCRGDNASWNSPETDKSAQKISIEQAQISATEELRVANELDIRGREQINIAAVTVEIGAANSETINAEPAQFLLNVGGSSNGNIVESLLQGERSQQQQLYKGELGMVQDCSGRHWEIEPSAREDFLIVNSKNENVSYHFQSENRPIWKMGEFEDFDGLMQDGRDENANRGKYTKYDADDDDRNGAIFDENQLMRCSRMTTAADNGNLNRSAEHGFFSGKSYKGVEDYVAASTTYGDRSTDRKHSLDSSQQAAAPPRKDPTGCGQLEEHDVKKQTDATSYCNTGVAKPWRIAGEFGKNPGYGGKDSSADGTYTSEWKDMKNRQATGVCPENKREEGKDREFWSEYVYSTVGNYGEIRTPTVVNMDAGVEGKKDPEFWNNAGYTSADKVNKTAVVPEGAPGETKTEFWAIGKNTKEKAIKNKELSENVGDEFWSDKLYSPIRKVNKKWTNVESKEKKGDELKAVPDSHVKTEKKMKKEIPVRTERKMYSSPEKQPAAAANVKNSEEEVKVEKERAITREFATPTLQMKKFIHLPEKYTMGTHKHKPLGDPVVMVTAKNYSTDTNEKLAGTPEVAKEVPSHKDKPINIYEICKPTVIKPRLNTIDETDNPTEAKEKRRNVRDTEKEKRRYGNETVTSARTRRREQDTGEANNTAMFEETQGELRKVGNKDTKGNEVIRRTRHASTSGSTKISETKLEQRSTSKEQTSRREKIGDWFSQDKGSTSPTINARRSTKRKNEESASRCTDFTGGSKQQQLSLMKQGIRESNVSKDRESPMAKDRVKATGLYKKQPARSQSKDNVKDAKVFFGSPCGDGKRSKKWKMYIISERKSTEGNTKQSTESKAVTRNNVSKSRESKDRMPLGAVNQATWQGGIRPTDLSTVRAEDEMNTRHTRAKQHIEARKTNRSDRDEMLTLGDKKDKSAREMSEQSQKHSRRYKLDLGENLKDNEFRRGNVAKKRPGSTTEEFGFGQLVQLATHGRDRDREKSKLMIGKPADKHHKQKVFKIDVEEKMSNKSRQSTRDNTSRKQKVAEQKDDQSHLLEASKQYVRADQEERDRANKAFFDRYRHRQRSQKSETTISEEHKNRVENSKSEVLAPSQNEDNQSPFARDTKMANPSRKEERKKWKEEIRRPRYASENKNTSVTQRGSGNKGLEDGSGVESINVNIYKGYIADSGQGEGLKQSEPDNQQGQDMAVESCVDAEPSQQPLGFELVCLEADHSKISSKNPDSDTKKGMCRQNKENRKRQDAVKKSRIDANQDEPLMPTLIDSSVVNTVARAWMDDTERLGISSLQESKLFSPSVLLQQTSGSLSANCHCINSPREMNNTSELANQQNPLTIGGDYFDVFPRPTLLPVRTYQNFESGEDDHRTRPSSSDSDYAVCKLCPKNYFDTYTSGEQSLVRQSGYTGDTPCDQEKQQKREKNVGFSKGCKPDVSNTDKISSGIEKIVSRSYFARTEKGSENRKHASKDDSFVNTGHLHTLANEAKFGEKQIRQGRSTRTPERPQAANDNQPAKQQAQDRKRGVDLSNNKKSKDNSKVIRKTGSADNVKPTTETSKVAKTANEYLKTTARPYGYKPPKENNSQANKTPSENQQQGKGHMFSYKVSSKGNRPEVVKAEPPENKPVEVTIPAGVAGVSEIVAGKVETVRHEAPPEPVQIGLFARILNTLTRSNNTQITSQPLKEDAGKAERNPAPKPEPTETSTTNTADGSSAVKEKNSAGSKYKTVKTRSPLQVKDTKNLRSDYKQNVNGNASVSPAEQTIDSFAELYTLKKHQQSIASTVANGRLCISSLNTALEWKAMLPIMIFMLYLGTFCPAVLRRLNCPLPPVWELLYKYGFISMGIDACLISQILIKSSGLGSKVPQSGMFFNVSDERFSAAVWRMLVYAATVFYTYLNGPFLSAFGHALMKVLTFLFSAIIFAFSSTMQLLEGIETLHKPPSFSGINTWRRHPFYSGSYQSNGDCDFTYWEGIYLKAMNHYPARCQ